MTEANFAVRCLKILLQEHKMAVQHELDMVVVAEASPLTWKTVVWSYPVV